MKDNKSILGQNLVRARKRLGLTQSVVAETLGLERSRYAHYEKDTTPSADLLRKLATILGVTTDEKAWRKLSLSWGVTPVMSEVFQSLDVLFYTAGKLAKSTFDLNKGDRIVITGGMTNGSSGNTNLIKVEKI